MERYIATYACQIGKSPIPKPKAGFTLVELLVVITIIGILIALLLPAVQAAREAARCLQCKNNIKQIALALHNHHVAMGALPPGCYWVEGQGGYSMGVTWIGSILPYIEQGNVQVLDGVSTGGGDRNMNLITTKLGVMHCPTDEPQCGVAWVNWNPSNPEVYIKGNYGGNNGGGPMQWTADPFCKDCAIPRTRGIFMNNSQTNWSSIFDGLGSTVMIAELIQGGKSPGPYTSGGWQGVMSYWEGCLYQHERTPNSSSADWLRIGWCGTPIPDLPCIEMYDPYNTKLILTARSRHPGGVNVGMCDGSVQFISNSIDLLTWQNLGNPRDGNVIDATKF